MLRRSLALVLLCAQLTSGLAQAAPNEAELNAARKMFEDAQAHEAQGRWIEALNLLKRILTVKETAGIRFHMAVCEEHLGQLLAAEADYRRASELADKITGAEGATIVRQSSEALAKLKPRIPLLSFRSTDVPGLVVEVDGKPLSGPQLERPLSLDPGGVSVRASAPGRVPLTRTVPLIEGDNKTIDLTLSLDPSVAPAPASASAPASSVLVVLDPPPVPRRWLPFAVGGATLLAATVSVGFFLRHRRLSADTDLKCADSNYICDRAGRNDKLDDYQLYGLLSGGAAVAGIGLTTYLFLTLPSRPAKLSPTTSLIVTPSSVGLAGRW